MGKEWNSFFAVFFVMATSLSGCLGEDSSDDSPIVVEAGLPDGLFVTDSTGNYTDVAPLEMQFYFIRINAVLKEVVQKTNVLLKYLIQVFLRSLNLI